MAAPQPLAPGTAASVSVPATSANLGPGFDSMGLALELRDEVTLTVVAGPDVAEVEGEGEATLPRDGAHLILRLAHEHLRDRGFTAPGLHLRAVNRIPHARGLGSSAAAVVAAYAAAEALLPAALLLRIGGWSLASVSPEVFLHVDPGGRARSRPIKGTRRRDADPASAGLGDR